MLKKGNSLIGSIKNSEQAVAIIDLNGRITFWNSGSEKLFGYTKEEVTGKLPPYVPPGLISSLKTAFKDVNNGQVVSFKTRRNHKDNTHLNLLLSISPLLNEYQEVISFYCVYKKIEEVELPTAKKRTFYEIRLKILNSLKDGHQTINNLASLCEINWKTVKNHLTFLVGKGYVNRVFSSDYVKIFEINSKGLKYLDETGIKIQKEVLE